MAEARLSLARQGVREHLVDLAIAVTTMAAGRTLATRDKDFVRTTRVVPIELDVL